MLIRVLGPVEIEAQGEVLTIPRRQERCLLAVLALELNRAVPVDRLIDLLWDGDPPERGRRIVQGHVARLRAHLARAGAAGHMVELVTTHGGYRMSGPLDLVDAHRFRALVEDAAAVEDLADRVDRLRYALNLWRGAAFSNAAGERVRERLCVDLEERRLAAIEDVMAASLALDRERSILPELARITVEHPGRERLAELYLRALHQAGRTADALDFYQQRRSYLAEALGIDPGPTLRDLHRAILRDEPRLAPPAGVAAADERPADEASRPGRAREEGSRGLVAPRQLPPDIAGFTGRTDALAELDRLLPEGTDPVPPRVVVSAISGMAGVGKTALAVRWAHQVADQFPDGQIYVNLRGFDPGGAPTEPAQAVRGFLDALDVPAHRVPASVDAQVGLYRSLLADRRMLVLLDNARDTEQVRPLLPGSPGSLVVVTSRNQLTGLVATAGALPLTLDLLSHHEARQLLEQRLGTDRVATEPAAADEIITRCARLPLALAVVAARAATNPRSQLHALASELREAGSGLDAWSDPSATTDVRTVFSWSLRALTAEAVRLFRLLGVHPGPDFTVPAAASLAGMPVPRVRVLLRELAHAHLLDEHAPGRYTFHDLLRTYAAESAAAAEHRDEVRLALRRVLDHYLNTAVGGIPALSPHRTMIPPPPAAEGTVPEPLTGSEPALTWFTAEQQVVLNAVTAAARGGFAAHSWQLAYAASAYLDRLGRWREQLAMHRTGLAAAERLDDPTGRGYIACMLGQALIRLGRLDDAEHHLRQAVDRFEDLGDHAGQAAIHANLGMIRAGQQRHREAIHHFEQTLSLYRTVDHPFQEAKALNNLSMAHGLLGDHRRALEYGQQALTRAQECGSARGQAASLDSLGYAHHHLGDQQQALACYQQALDLCRAIADPFGQAEVLTHIGDTNHAAGNPGGAHSAWRAALEILRELDHPNAGAVDDRLARLAQVAL